MRHLRAILAGMLSLSGLMASAEDLTLTVRGATPQFRSQAPVPLDCVLNWNGSKLIEGRLVIEVKDLARTLVRYENPDIAMTFGDFTLRVVLPPLANESDTIDLIATFEAPAWGRFDLGKHTIKLPADWRRQFLMGVVVPEGDTSARTAFPYLDKLDLTAFRPQTELNVDGTRAPKGELTLADVRISARELPTLPAALCAWDVMVIAADTLPELRPVQRTAIIRWVDAGGSLMVMANGAADTEDARFLTELTGRTPGEDAFLVDDAHRLISEQDLILARRGLGRVVVAIRSPDKWSDREQRSAACWLWKVGSDAAASIDSAGVWPEVASIVRRPRMPEQELPPGVQAPPQLDQVEFHVPRYAPAALGSSGMLRMSLLPDSVQTVPLPVVVGVLCLFLFVIAPGDWFLLGLLKRRMLTWVFFPAACLLFTGIMVYFANRYMGQEDYRTAVRFVDWGAADRVSRVASVETVFTARARPVRIPLSDEVYGRVDTSGGSDWQGAVMEGDIEFTNLALPDPSNVTPTLRGRPTTSYQVELPVRKWAPVVFRHMEFAVDTKDVPAVDWGTCDWDAINADREAVADDLTERNPGGLVAVYHGSQQSRPRNSDRRSEEFAEFAADATVPPTEGLFAVVSRLSPNGHQSLEDLHLLDPTNPNEAVVTVVFGAEGDVIVHRRIFHRPAADSQP